MRSAGALILSLLCPALAAAAPIRIYLEDVDPAPLSGIEYAWVLGDGTTVSSLTPDGFATIGDLIAANEWDFSGVPPGEENASTVTDITPAETCNSEQCGYNPGGAYDGVRFLSREDRAFGTPGLVKTNAVTEREDLGSEVVIWLRAGAQKEGVSGGLGDGESRFCYDPDQGRTASPLWRLTHQDAGGRFYLQAGDTWQSPVFDCEQNVYNQVCGAPGLFDKIWTAACPGHTGTQSGEVLKEGIVTLPSGHRVYALVARTVADFCVYLGSTCGLKVDEVRTVVTLWLAPGVGTVVRLMSPQNAPDLTSFGTLAEADVTFGLFPPLDIQVTRTGPDSVDLSWDPGRVTDRIDGYRIYWDTDSGADSPYAFDSVRNPGQVAFNGTTATISGLDPLTDYYFTVTATSTFADPSTGAETTYESLLFPKQIPGPDASYPVEVQATTTDPSTCVPTTPVEGLTLERLADGSVRFCWKPSTDPCATGYRLRGSDSARGPATGFDSFVQDSGLTTCWTASPAPSETFFLVSATGGGGEGPWDHYGR